MKKFLSILLLLTMCVGVFAACTGEKDPAETTPPEGGATLEQAVEYLTSTYKSDEGKATPADYKLIAQIPIDGVTFTVTWTVDHADIKITLADGLYTVDVPAKNDKEVTYTLTATVADADGKTATKTFTRTLPVYDNSAAVGADDIKENTPYKLYLVQVGVGKTLFATTETQSDNKYIKTDVDPKKGADFYAEKVEGGYKFYTEINGVKNYVHAKTTTAEDGKVSKYIGYATESECVYYFKADCNAWFVKIDNIEYVVGTYSSYETICISEGTYMTPDTTGVTQFPVLIMDKAAAEALDPTVPEIPEAEEKTIPEFTEIALAQPDKGAATLGKYIVTGKITEIKNTEYGNMYIADEAGNQLYIYGMYDKTGDVRFDKMNPQPKVGDTVVVLGVACNYNGAQMKNAWVLKLNGEDYVSSGSGSTDTPDTPVVPDVPSVDDVKENTEYKFVLTQVTVGKVLYMTAELDQGKFIKGTTDPTAALDFFAEKVEGGYKFYTTIDGAKMYLHAHTETKEDGKISKFIGYAAESNNIWYYKADVNGWFVTIDGAEYVLGTYNTYETFSMSEAKHLTAENTGKTQFPGNLIAKADAEALPPVEDKPETPDTPSTPAEGAVIPEVGKSYKLYFIQKNKNNTVYYMTGVLDGYYMGSSENAAEGVEFAIEATDGGYYLYCTVGGAKKYVNVVKSGNYTNAKYEDAATTVWTIDETLKTVVATISDGSYILGTKADGTYTTLGPMKSDSGCMYAQFILPGNTPSVPETPDTPDTPSTPAGDKTITEFNTIASAQPDKGDTTTDKYTVSGKITEIKNTQYGNMYIEDDAGNKLYIYGVYSNDGKVRFDAMNPQPKVGDTITVTGVACNYNGPQMKNGCVLKLNGADYKAEAPVEPDPVPDDSDASISFADTSTRTELTTEKQVWSQNGITVTGEKAASTNDVKDYAGPARFYKSTALTIAATGMKKIVVTCNTAGYAEALAASTASAGTASVEGKVVTITFSGATDSVKFAALSAQVRIDMIQIYK